MIHSALVLTALLASPQGVEPRPLTDAEQMAMARITRADVEAIVSYLASDELGGRGTGSEGFVKASEYVAERFADAGLEGLGPDGSFFLHADDEAVPDSGVVLQSADGAAIPTLKLLSAARDSLSFDGELTDLGVDEDGRPVLQDGELAGPVIFAQPAPKEGLRMREPYPTLMALRDFVRVVQRRGASALVIRVGGDSALLGDLSPRQLGILSRRPMPILLVMSDVSIVGPVHLQIPALELRRSETNRNVCGVLRGSDPKLRDEAIVISAHLDHLGVRDGRDLEDKIFNGADDDASGCTGVIAMAEAFRALPTPPARSVVFVTFWGEEAGLRGSRDFCDRPPWPLEKIVANVNLEMLGRPEEGDRFKAWMTGWLKSDLGKLVAKGASRAGVEVFRHRRYSPMLYGSSDNASFVRQGVIGHSFSAGSLHRDYHQASDEWKLLDLEHMTKVIQGMFAGCLPLADGTFTPKKREERK